LVKVAFKKRWSGSSVKNYRHLSIVQPDFPHKATFLSSIVAQRPTAQKTHALSWITFLLFLPIAKPWVDSYLIVEKCGQPLD
jgi:hypothetical protein